MSQGVYITGTDTGIGKTVASCALLHALRMHGGTAVGMKPVASGCERFGGGWRNADALALIDAGSERFDYSLHNPYALPAATAPQLAARDAAMTVTLAPILDAYRRIAAHADNVVVEGVGGWAAPLADGLDQADLVRALDLPVLLVVGLRLGCLSHARLSARAIESDGCRLLGWVGSAVDPAFERADEYVHLLEDALPVPCMGLLPHAADAVRLASHLDVSQLL